MKEIKIYLKSKEFWIPLCILMALIIYGMWQFFKMTYLEFSWYNAHTAKITLSEFIKINAINGISFFEYATYEGPFREILMILITVLIPFSAISSIIAKIKGCFFKNQLLRSEYSNVIIKEVIFAYLKGILPILISFLIPLIIGIIVFGTNFKASIDYTSSLSDISLYFPHIIIYFLYVLWVVGIFTMEVVNISLVLARKIKNIYANMIFTFLILFAFFFGISLVSLSILEQELNPFLIVEMNQPKLFLINTCFYLPISFISFYICYRNKLKVVSSFE